MEKKGSSRHVGDNPLPFEDDFSNLDHTFLSSQEPTNSPSRNPDQSGVNEDVSVFELFSTSDANTDTGSPFSHFDSLLDENQVADDNNTSTHHATTTDTPRVCFGAITEVGVTVHDTTATVYSQQTVHSFEVHKHGDSYGLWYDGIIIAIPDAHACGIIHKLGPDIDDGTIGLQAFISSDQWPPNMPADSKTLILDLNVYGLRDNAHQVGKLLSSIGISLQQPLFGLQGFAYYNPHFLHIAELRGQHVTQTPLLNIDTGGSDNLFIGDAKNITPGTADFEDEVATILDSLTHNHILENRNTDPRMKTELRDHQKQAVDFMLRRETGELPAELSMWHELEDDVGEKVYQHIITGFQRPRNAEAKGGILADEMGLGKSIVSLSMIASSYDRALEFGMQTAKGDMNVSTGKCSKATLVIVPSSLLITSWFDETRRHLYPGSLQIWKYHGAGRHEDIDKLYTSDIVLTTYATVVMESSTSKKSLMAIEWFRIILDEAHDIRNRSTKQFQVISSLAAQHRWCLSGTPIQNTLQDLGALVAFLRVPMLENAAIFRTFIMNQGDSENPDRFENLRLLLKSICLRRTRKILGIADPVPEVRKVNLTPEERMQYQQIFQTALMKIEYSVNRRGKSMNSVLLDSLLRLRLFCNNGVGNSGTNEILSYLQQVKQTTCTYCAENIHSIDMASDTDGGTLMSKCYHLVCRECLPRYYAEKKRCPDCRAGNRDPDILEAIRGLREPKPMAESALHTTTCPSKLKALVEDLQCHPREKSIVFSSWKTTLDLVSRLLAHEGSQSLYIFGSVPLRERNQILNRFRSPIGPNILLMTLGTGAVGLNLAIASRIYLLEPQWNPSVELQAMSRALRLDREGSVTIIRYIVQDSVEDSNILSLQTNKLREARGGFEKERMQECRNLFSVSEEDSNQAN